MSIRPRDISLTKDTSYYCFCYSFSFNLAKLQVDRQTESECHMSPGSECTALLHRYTQSSV